MPRHARGFCFCLCLDVWARQGYGVGSPLLATLCPLPTAAPASPSSPCPCQPKAAQSPSAESRPVPVSLACSASQTCTCRLQHFGWLQLSCASHACFLQRVASGLCARWCTVAKVAASSALAQAQHSPAQHECPDPHCCFILQQVASQGPVYDPLCGHYYLTPQLLPLRCSRCFIVEAL